MAITINKQATDFINDYKTALTSYPISIQRATEKIDNLFEAIKKIELMPTRWPVCPYKNMGQRFIKGKKGAEKYQYNNLRLMVYEDKKAHLKIYVSYFVNIDEIIIYKVAFPHRIKEVLSAEYNSTKLYEAIMKDVAKIIKRHLIDRKLDD